MQQNSCNMPILVSVTVSVSTRAGNVVFRELLVTSHTSMITGTTNWLSVMRVTTVSVNVLLVMVSVTRPGPVGDGGSSMGGSGFRIVTDTVCVGVSFVGVGDLFRK